MCVCKKKYDTLRLITKTVGVVSGGLKRVRVLIDCCEGGGGTLVIVSNVDGGGGGGGDGSGR